MKFSASGSVSTSSSAWVCTSINPGATTKPFASISSAADPGAIAMRVDQDWFPMIDTAPNGGHIYQWTLGFHVSAFDLARKRGHVDVLDLLFKLAGPLDRLLDALWCADDARADAVLAANPRLVARAPERALRQVADAARNNNLAAVSAMLWAVVWLAMR